MLLQLRQREFWGIQNFAIKQQHKQLNQITIYATVQHTTICTCLSNFLVNFVHFIHHQFCTLHRSQKFCTWLADQFRTFHSHLHESVTKLQGEIKRTMKKIKYHQLQKRTSQKTAKLQGK